VALTQVGACGTCVGVVGTKAVGPTVKHVDAIIGSDSTGRHGRDGRGGWQRQFGSSDGGGIGAVETGLAGHEFAETFLIFSGEIKIGALQWSISLGWFDIATAVMMLSGFRVAPQHGHMDCVQCVVAYLVKVKHGAIQFCTEEPNFSALPDLCFDWMYSVYGQMKEILPADLHLLWASMSP